MHPIDPKPLSDYFDEGLEGRRNGATLRDNPYAAGSDQRREWNAGFCATVTAEGEEAPGLDPAEGDERRTAG